MIARKSALELQSIARAGGSLEVDATNYSSLELQSVARALTPGAILKVFGSDRMSALELQAIARAKAGQVVFA